jgi:hypothetical protein
LIISILGLNGLHGLIDGLAYVFSLGEVLEVFESGFIGDVEADSLDVVGRSYLPPPSSLAL